MAAEGFLIWAGAGIFEAGRVAAAGAGKMKDRFRDSELNQTAQLSFRHRSMMCVLASCHSSA